MKTTDSVFENLLHKATEASKNYIHYSPTQIARGDHLKNDPSIGERAWSIPETTGRFLYALITHLNLEHGLELGTSTGYSTLWIAAGLSESHNWQLITIEKNPEKTALATELLQTSFGESLQFKNELIENFLPQLQGKQFDFIFMDAERGKYHEYWKILKNYIHEKSIVVIDNALRDQESVRTFQELLKNDSGLSTYLHPLDNGLFLVSRSGGPYENLMDIISGL